LSDALAAIAPEGENQPGLDALRPLLARRLGLQASEVLAVFVPSHPMLRTILHERVPQRQVRLLLVVLGNSEDLEGVAHQLTAYMGGEGVLYTAALCTAARPGEWHIPTIICRSSDGLGARVRDCLSVSAQILPPAAPSLVVRTGGWHSSTESLIIDDRVMRMARLSLASSPAMVFVGPPGTGKTTLVRKILEEVADNPKSFGLSRPPKEPKWVTPSDTWTSLDLVGGESTDRDGHKRFRQGHLLDAIRRDRWLVLDEVNRANMDRIFGGMLTWMSGQRVELGRASGDLASPPVVLDWSPQPESQAVRAELLDCKEIVTTEPIKFLAGTDWRLLGTYNGQDAQRLFQFGQALGRRFSRVPIPMISPAQFARALSPRIRNLPPEVGKAILGVYTAHYRTTGAQLGPAVFLNIASYVEAGIKLPHITNEVVIARRPGVVDVDAVAQLVAEAYLCLAGTWLSQMPPDRLAALGKAMLQAGFAPSEWEWILQLLPMLG
jgi:DNA polymerase III delta prime subunit